ncbi:recombinase RecB [Rickettsia endosymbiont of Halotydeus destructor]|uniref:recombinase RecB n=1 Tax=Rickettsia endosymbiont of Halotydeus destructor TaxID=2996754 RepID=UPI003BAEE46E
MKQKREDNIKEIEAHNKADDSFAKMLISLVGLASNAYQTFIGSTIAEKRGLINLVFANLTLKPEKLEFMLRPPFDSFIKTREICEWRTREESNP